MSKRMKKTFALVGLTLALTAVVPTVAIAKNGADNAPGDVRHGADDAPNHG